ncbi:COR domain-containing protein, partial [uncultured Rubinisphaera sp.]|uniref:COR domain-containing protein n=1 Tax=uncultured Rubinisphaera sp. TaxID=1678686 RepID=UPI0030DB8FB4
TRFPNLTHLHLWQIENLTSLPELPSGLKCLDIQGCKSLETIINLPTGMEILVIDDCPQLNLSPDQHHTAFIELDDLSLQGTIKIEQAWIRAVLENSPNITKLDLSRCLQLERISKWHNALLDLRLNHCLNLGVLPAWPVHLRRLELRHAEAIKHLSDFPATLDYIDLAWTRSLHALPKERQQPRTLFLYGSGVLEPPASEHGKDDQENVAADVHNYFNDVQLTGKGTIKRCKLLILGNGEAGKTSLSYNLIGKDCEQEHQAGRLESTHGVQFWDMQDFEANVDTRLEPVHLHIWDFGGQEIYHNTHRLFMSKGTVFVLVWNPSQDGQTATDNGTGFVDEWRPLQYWIDFIRLSCDHTPRIAIVCSHHSVKTEELEQRWKAQVREEFHDSCKCFYVDSWNKTGQRSDLEDWLQDEVGKVISTQGTAVPSYWEVAQEMVEVWVSKIQQDAVFAEEFNSISTDQFKNELLKQISNSRTEPRFRQLDDSLTESLFELTEDRIRRTLNFLTRSGWLYWDPALFEGRVIVGQQWALDGLYAALERRRGTEVYKNLCISDGRFTQSDLDEWIWRELYSTQEQKLLISFMEVCGLCFQLRKAEDAWREEDIYVSFEHLPCSKELRLQSEFDRALPDMNIQESKIEVPYLHKYDWQTFLIDAGKKYGSHAVYASDGLMLKTEDGVSVLISCWIDPKKGIGGELELQVAGNNAGEVKEKITADIRHRFPEQHQPGNQRSDAFQSTGQAKPVKEVFISYAWNSESIPDQEYEAPADAVEQFLLKHNFQIKYSDPREVEENSDVSSAGALLRDKQSIQRGSSILEFMKNGARSPHVVLIHSDRYWTSVNCMFELHVLDRELSSNSGKSFAEVVIPIEHPTSKIQQSEKLKWYLNQWDLFLANKDSVPTRMLLAGWNQETAVIHSKSHIDKYSKELSDLGDLNINWSSGKEAAVVESLRLRLGLPQILTDENSNE